ncbi:hypothetical protein LTR95_005615 [Oleoguttula sp. CCFEE 5521]
MATHSDDIKHLNEKVLRLANELAILDRSEAWLYASVRRTEKQLREAREELKIAQLCVELCEVRKSEEDLKKRCGGLETQYKDTLRMLMILMPVVVDGLGGDKVHALMEGQGLAKNSAFRVLFSDATKCRMESSDANGGAAAGDDPEVAGD